jgi:hypothetical protein
MHRPDEGDELKINRIYERLVNPMLTGAVQGGLIRSTAQAQVLFEHAVYGEEGTNLLQLRRAAYCSTLRAAAKGCFTGALTDRRHRSKVRNGG